jgi:hypothetical protein
MEITRIRILGGYLLLISLLQSSLYIVLSGIQGNSVLYFFNPRIGLYLFEVIARGSMPVAQSTLSWASAFLIFMLGLFLLLGRRLSKAYIACEIVLLIPNILFFSFVILSTYGTVNSFSIRRFIVPPFVMIVFSIIPLSFAIWSHLKKDELER